MAELRWPRLMLPNTRGKVLRRVEEWYDALPKDCVELINGRERRFMVGRGSTALQSFAILFADPIAKSAKGTLNAESLLTHCRKMDLGSGWEEPIEKRMGCFAHLNLL